MECLKLDGNVPVESDKLTMLVIVGAMTDEICLRRYIGIGSRSHCLLGASLISLVTSSTVAGLKKVKGVGLLGGGMCGSASVRVKEKLSCILVILSVKNDANF